MHLDLNSTHLYALILGLVVGLVAFALAARSLWRTSRELRRYKAMLADKLELERSQITGLSAERDRLLKDNENLRVKVQQLNERPDNKLQRDLEVYARAEKQMKINAPGFAGAWELAKEGAHHQIADEEKGNSLPQRLFRRLVGGGAPAQVVDAGAKNGASPDNAH